MKTIRKTIMLYSLLKVAIRLRKSERKRKDLSTHRDPGRPREKEPSLK
jgi:hypothetical protein